MKCFLQRLKLTHLHLIIKKVLWLYKATAYSQLLLKRNFHIQHKEPKASPQMQISQVIQKYQGLGKMYMRITLLTWSTKISIIKHRIKEKFKKKKTHIET